MRDTQAVARFAPPTPRSRKIGGELRRLREGQRLTQEQVAKEIDKTSAWVSRVEAGDIKIDAGGVMELLRVYGIDLDGELALDLISNARAMRRELGWWQRLKSLPSRFATYIAYEHEATDLFNYEPLLVPGLLQTPDYARAIFAAAPDREEEEINNLVEARMKRQEVLRRQKGRLRLHAIISESALRIEVGDRAVLRGQLVHLIEVARLPNVRLQVVRFAAGASMADNSGFAILNFAEGTPLGYIDTLAGGLFLEAPEDIDRLTAVYDNLNSLALSPAESITVMGELAHAIRVEEVK